MSRTGTTFDPGQILIVMYPFTDQTAAKLRPALVVSSAKFNTGDDFVVVPLSSRAGADEYSYLIPDSAPYFAATKLRTTSSVKFTKPITITADVVCRKLGILPADVLEDIRSRIRSVFS